MTITEQTRLRRDGQADRLEALGWAVDDRYPSYQLPAVLKRFQAAHLNVYGRPLAVDGVYGLETERALFESYQLPNAGLAERVLAVARSQVGISEIPPGSNRGPQVDLVLKSVGLGPGYAWCAASVHWVYGQASRQLGIKNPCPKNAGVLNQWDLAGYPESGLQRITRQQALAVPTLIRPGCVFVLDFGNRTGHMGIVESVSTRGYLTTYEGNSNYEGSREGVAFTKQTKRTVSSINKGFILYPA